MANASRVIESVSTRGKRSYKLNPAVRIMLLDTSCRGTMYQVLLGNRRYQVNENMVRLLESLRDAKTETELEEMLPRIQVGANDSGYVGLLVFAKILLVEGDGPRDVEDAGQPLAQRRRNPLTLRLPLIPRWLLLPLTSRLQSFHAKRAVALFVPFIVISHALFFAFGGAAKPNNLNLTGTMTAALMAALIGCVFFHELGHLSACERYGARHGEVGIGFFLIWPVAYADVTDCWSLTRYQRAVVDSGGVYFHSICSGICCCIWLVTGHPVPWAMVYAIIGSTLININPFIKFDGYWFLTDITGIPSLHRSASDTWDYVVAMISGKRNHRKPEVLNTHPFIVTLFITYCFGSAIFVLYLMRRIAMYLPGAVMQVPEHLLRLWHMASMWNFGWEFWKLTLGTLIVCLTVYSLSFMVWQRLRGYAKQAVRIVRALEGSK